MTIYHKHHIIPKHIGGSDDPSNLISLTIEEHAESHRILWKEIGAAGEIRTLTKRLETSCATIDTTAAFNSSLRFQSIRQNCSQPQTENILQESHPGHLCSW